MLGNGNGNTDKDLASRAFQIVAQLGSDAAKARQVLSLCNDMVDRYMGDDNAPKAARKESP